MKATEFKRANANRWIWYNGAMGLETALLNNYITDTREDAVYQMAQHDSVSCEEVDKDFHDWYYIISVEEIDDEQLEEVLIKINTY